MEINRYNHTKIYKLVDCVNHFFYIGSTCDILSKRLYQHKAKAKQTPDRKVYKYFDSVGWENVRIVLIEEHVLQNREQQLREEDRVLINYINDPLCLNSLRAFCGLDKNIYNKERYIANKQECLSRQKEYYINHADEIKNYQKEYNEKNKEKVCFRYRRYYLEHAEQTKERSKKHYNSNKETLLEEQLCPCGSTYVLMGKNRHERTIKHQKWIKENELSVVD